MAKDSKPSKQMFLSSMHSNLDAHRQLDVILMIGILSVAERYIYNAT